MNPEAFLASFDLAPVSRPARKPKPALTLVPTMAEAPRITAWTPLPGFGPIVPTLAELYRQERAGLTVSAYHALKAARQRLYELRETFPDQIEDPVKLARFARAQGLTGPKLAAMMPPWLKTWTRNHSAPEPFVFIPNQPPKYPGWTCSCGCPPARHDMRWNRVLA